MEPATMSDLKEFMKELRKIIKEAVAEALGNSKPALEHATTSTASQLVAMDAKVSPPACSSPDQGTSALYLAPTATIDIVPEIDVDATGVAAPAPTKCSTDGLSHNVDGDDHMAAWQATWSVPTSFTKPLEVSPTEACQLSADFKLDNLAPAECSMKCFVETPCALTPMFMPEVTESIKQQGHVLRPLPWPSFVQSQDEGQLNDTRSLESWFGFCVTEAWLSRFLGLTLGDDTSYGAYKNITPCRPRFQAKPHEGDCCSALSFALHTTSSCVVVYSQVLSEMRLLYFELPGIGMSWTYVQLIGASGRLFPALESVATNIVFMSRETDEVQPWAYPFCMENLLLICPCSQPTSLQFRSSLKLDFSLATLISLHYVILTVGGATGYLHSLQPKPPWLSNVPATFIQVAIEVEKRGVQNLAEQQKERVQMTELLKQQLNHANQKMKLRASANGAEFMSGV